MKRNRQKNNYTSAFLLLITYLALASPSHSSELKLNGFLSIAGYQGSSSEIGYKSILTNQHYSRNHQWEFDDLSLIGGQVNYQFNSQWELVSQIVLRNEWISNEFDRIKIATINYRPDSAWLFRLGRFYPRSFLMSESRSIGYAHPDILPVQDFYAQLPLPYIDGLDLTYTTRSEIGLLKFNLHLGQTEIAMDFVDTGETSTRFDNLVGINGEIETGNWMFRLSYTQVEQMAQWRVATQIEDVFRLLANPAAFSPDNEFIPWLDGVNILNKIDEKGSVFKYLTLASEYTHDNLHVRSEVAYLSSGSFLLPDTRTGYMRFSYAYGAWTPFAIVSFINSEQGYSYTTTPDDNYLDALDAFYQQDSRFILKVVSDFINPTYKQNTFALGMRWDFARQQAFKFQYEHKRVKENAAGLWQKDRFAETDAQSVNVFLVSYDRMF